MRTIIKETQAAEIKIYPKNEALPSEDEVVSKMPLVPLKLATL
jgi:hypothetical protein